MKLALISNLFISLLLIVPLILNNLGIFPDVSAVLVSGLTPLLIFLFLFNLFGLLCLKIISKVVNYIDTKDLLDHTKEQEKLENHPVYKTYRLIVLTVFFGLLMYDRMYLTTIFACIWWLSRHLFKVQFDKFIKNIE